MNRTQKTSEIDRVRARFEDSVATVLVDFQGMTVQAVTQLRRDFKKSGVEYRVVKNTLIRHALKDSPFKAIAGDANRKDSKAGLHASLTGMTGVAWCKEDPAAAAKVIEAFKKATPALGEKLKVKAGLLGDQIRDATWVEKEMPRLPGLAETRATLLATLQTPAQNLVAMINAPAQNLVYLRAAWAKKLEDEQAGAAKQP